MGRAKKLIAVLIQAVPVCLQKPQVGIYRCVSVVHDVAFMQLALLR